MTAPRRSIICLLLFGCLSLSAYAAKTTASTSGTMTVDKAYPGVVSGVLSFASLGELPKGCLLESGDIRIGREQVRAEIAKADEPTRASLAKNQLFLLEQMATKAFLLNLARGEAAKHKDIATTGTEADLIGGYIRLVGSKATVTDKEVAEFYQQNKDMCGGASLDQVKGELKGYVLQQKQQQVVTEYFRTLGQRIPIKLASSWVSEQAALALDNPVDKARKSGRPSMVDFGASGCRPCEMMTPVLADLKKKYEGKVNVQFVHVREQEVLAARYGIEAIPVQVFFDKNGKEVLRHTGFFPQAEIEKQLAGMGVK